MSQTEEGKNQVPSADRPACLSVVMPVYNEEATLLEVATRVLAIPNLLELIIVDDLDWKEWPQ